MMYPCARSSYNRRAALRFWHVTANSPKQHMSTLTKTLELACAALLLASCSATGSPQQQKSTPAPTRAERPTVRRLMPATSEVSRPPRPPTPEPADVQPHDIDADARSEQAALNGSLRAGNWAEV